MTFSLKNSVITGKTLKPPRILLYALPKVGKSTFGSKFPKHIFMDMEGGLDNINCTKTPRVRTAEEAMSIIAALYKEKHDYKCLIIDTIDWLEQVICKQVATTYDKKTVEEIPFGKGYPLVVYRWSEFLNAIDVLRVERNMTILFLSHAEIKKYTPPVGDEYDIYSPKLYGKKDKTQTSLALIEEFTDIIMFANYKTITKETGDGFNKRKQAVATLERTLFTDSSAPGFIAGNRYNLKKELPFSFEAFSADFAKKTKQDVKEEKK